MTTNPVTEQLAADVDACRAFHHCPSAACYTCTRSRQLAAKLATDLPDTDLRVIGEVLLHAIYVIDAVYKQAVLCGVPPQIATATAVWAAMEAATSLYRSPTIPDGIDG